VCPPGDVDYNKGFPLHESAGPPDIHPGPRGKTRRFPEIASRNRSVGTTGGPTDAACVSIDVWVSRTAITFSVSHKETRRRRGVSFLLLARRGLCARRSDTSKCREAIRRVLLVRSISCWSTIWVTYEHFCSIGKTNVSRQSTLGVSILTLINNKWP